MKVFVEFEEGVLSMRLEPQTDAEQRMVAAVIEQPVDENVMLDKSLISAVLRYDGHWTNKRITSLKVCVYQPNREKENK